MLFNVSYFCLFNFQKSLVYDDFLFLDKCQYKQQEYSAVELSHNANSFELLTLLVKGNMKKRYFLTTKLFISGTFPFYKSNSTIVYSTKSEQNKLLSGEIRILKCILMHTNVYFFLLRENRYQGQDIVGGGAKPRKHFCMWNVDFYC